MAVTQGTLDKLVSMYTNGILSSEYQGRKVQYRSMSELGDAIAATAQILDVDNPILVSAARQGPRRHYLRFKNDG